jgi:ABC-2 type transport system permease protein
MVNQKKKDLLHLALVLLAVVLVQVFAQFFFTRIDFTKEKRFTLSETTEGILSNLKEPVKITVYLEGDFPAGFKRLRNATKDLLGDYKAYAGANVQFEFIDPAADKNQQEQQLFFEELYSKGIEPTNLSVKQEGGLTQKLIFPAAMVSFKGREIPVKLLQTRIGLNPEEVLNNSIQNLEYAFTSTIKKITAGGKPRVAFTEGHQELADLQLQDAMQALSEGYEVGRVDLKEITWEGLKKIKLLIIPKPNEEFTELEKFKIDQYLMQGGKVFWAIDQVHAELDSMQQGNGEQLAFPKKLNLDDQLFKYGIRINYDLVGDMNCMQIPLNVGNIAGEGQIQMVPWLFYPIIMPFSNNPIVKNLEGIKTEFINTIDTIAVNGLRQEVLLTTSPFSRKLSAPTLISLNMVEQTPDPKTFQSEPKPVCVLVEGKFTSIFKNRMLPEGIPASAFIPESKFTKMVVFSDGDILKNQISATDGSVFPLGYDRYTQQTFGNKTFLLNLADFLTNDSELIKLRSKEIKLRLLDKAKIIEEKLTWQLVNMLFPIVLIVVSGIFQHIYRKRRYTA